MRKCLSNNKFAIFLSKNPFPRQAQRVNMIICFILFIKFLFLKINITINNHNLIIFND